MLLNRLSGLALNTPGQPHRDPLPRANVPTVGISRAMPDIPEGYLTNVINLMDRRPEKSRIGKPGYTHVSSLFGGCVRQYVAASRFNVEILNSVTGGHRVLWRIGRAVETHVRDSFIEGKERQGIYGEWRCTCKRLARVGLYQSGSPCRVCGDEAKHYFEPVLYDETNKIVGSPDLTTLIGSAWFTPTEVKSMNKEQFDKLEAPLPDHINQAAMYRHLYRQQGYAVHDKVIIMYTKKDFQWGSPYKEYHVDCTAPLVQGMVDASIEQAALIKRSMETQTLPGRTLCTGPRSPRAKQCPVAHLCFQMD